MAPKVDSQFSRRLPAAAVVLAIAFWIAWRSITGPAASVPRRAREHVPAAVADPAGSGPTGLPDAAPSAPERRELETRARRECGAGGPRLRARAGVPGRGSRRGSRGPGDRGRIDRDRAGGS